MIIFPGVIGAVAASGKGAVAPPAPLNLQVSTDNIAYSEGKPFPLDATMPQFTFVGQTRTFYVKALGTGTENINVSTFSPFNYSISPSSFSLSGGGVQSFMVTLTSAPFFDSSETISITSTTSGGDSAEISISCSTGGGGGFGGP